MFENIPYVTLDVLMKNPLINELSNEEEWTFSHLETKIPQDANYFLDTEQMMPANITQEPYPLVSLDRLNQVDALTNINRAYLMHAEQNRVFVIDVEPKAPDQVKYHAALFPAHYTEISKNGGVHLLIKVPEDLINDENRYIFDELVQVKQEDGYFEYFFNSHFMTISRRMIDKPQPDFENNEQDRQKLINLLQSIVELDKPRKEQREAAKLVATKYEQEKTNNRLVQELLKTTVIQSTIIQQKEKADELFKQKGEDHSRYERSVATACVGRVERLITAFKQQNTKNAVLQAKIAKVDDSDIIAVAYEMMKQIIPERDKHITSRNGLPWLVWQAQESLTYVRGRELQEQNKQAKNNK